MYKFTHEQIYKMINTQNRCILVSKKYIYDVTKFADKHPGGSSCLWKKCKEHVDCSVDYNFHGNKGKKIWDKYKIGILTDSENNIKEKKKIFCFFLIS